MSDIQWDDEIEWDEAPRGTDPVLQRLGGGIAETFYLGPKQLLTKAFGSPESARRVDEQVRSYQQAQEEGSPEGWDVARGVGNAVGLAPSMIGAGAPLRAGLAGAASGFTQIPGSMEERAVSGVLGGVLGPIGEKGGQALQKLITPEAKRLTEGQLAAQKNAADLGFRQSPGYATGNKAFQKFEAAMEASPITSGAIDSLKDYNEKTFNRIAAKAIGEDAEELSAPVLGRAFDRIGGVFESFKTERPVQMNPTDIQQRLLKVIDDYQGQYLNAGDVSQNQAFRLLDNFGLRGGATQAQLVQLSSNLNRAVKNQMTSPNGDRVMGQALADVKDIVDDVLESSLTGADQQALQQARQQYRSLMQITKSPNIVNSASGNISGRNLARSLQTTDRPGYLRGKNESDLYNAARFVQAFPEVVGNSGTATRQFGLLDIPAAMVARPLMSAYMSAPSVAATKGITAGSDLSRKILADAIRGGSIPTSTASAEMLAQMLLESSR